MSRLSISRIDTWLIDAAAFAAPRVSTVLLDACDLRQEWADFRTDMTGWTSAIMERRVAALILDGVISVFQDDEVGQQSDVDLGAFQAYLANRSLHRKTPLFYRLTCGGTRYWESRFTPRWDTFFRTQRRVVTGNIELIRLQCGSSELRDSLVLKSFDLLCLDRKFGLQRVKSGETLNWRPVYWKRLPRCFYVQFVGRYCDSPNGERSDATTMMSQPWGRAWPSDGT